MIMPEAPVIQQLPFHPVYHLQTQGQTLQTSIPCRITQTPALNLRVPNTSRVVPLLAGKEAIPPELPSPAP